MGFNFNISSAFLFGLIMINCLIIFQAIFVVGDRQGQNYRELFAGKNQEPSRVYPMAAKVNSFNEHLMKVSRDL